MGLSLITG